MVPVRVTALFKTVLEERNTVELQEAIVHSTLFKIKNAYFSPYPNTFL